MRRLRSLRRLLLSVALAVLLVLSSLSLARPAEAHGPISWWGTWFCLGYTAYMGTGPTWYKVNAYYTIYYFDGHTLRVFEWLDHCPK